MSSWYYGILLPKNEEDTSLSFLLNLTIVQLKQILESCGLITIKDNNMKFVLNTSGMDVNIVGQCFF